MSFAFAIGAFAGQRKHLSPAIAIQAEMIFFVYYYSLPVPLCFFSRIISIVLLSAIKIFTRLKCQLPNRVCMSGYIQCVAGGYEAHAL